MAGPSGIPEPPTPTALAAKAFMARIDNETYLRIIRTKAHLGGWAGSRAAGCWDVRLCDAIAEAAVDAVLERFREWAAEAGTPEDGGRPANGDDTTQWDKWYAEDCRSRTVAQQLSESPRAKMRRAFLAGWAARPNS